MAAAGANRCPSNAHLCIRSMATASMGSSTTESTHPCSATRPRPDCSHNVTQSVIRVSSAIFSASARTESRGPSMIPRNEECEATMTLVMSRFVFATDHLPTSLAKADSSRGISVAKVSPFEGSVRTQGTFRGGGCALGTRVALYTNRCSEGDACSLPRSPASCKTLSSSSILASRVAPSRSSVPATSRCRDSKACTRASSIAARCRRTSSNSRSVVKGPGIARQ
mmetsp:Transcript_34108/g.105408  ORF Transcript_34108/g.105408 Transcript_34108/m.105408 type:complete len:225 (-) Transcript_34108:13-687(-)